MAATARLMAEYQHPRSSAVLAGVVTGTPSIDGDLVFLECGPRVL